MLTQSRQSQTALRLLEHMFEIELSFIRSPGQHLEVLSTAFHRDVVVHEPASLPYAGDWRGLTGVGALLLRMREAWSSIDVRGMQATLSGDTVFMACTLQLTARCNGAVVEQPFAEVLRFDGDLLLEGTPFYFDTGELARTLANGSPAR